MPRATVQASKVWLVRLSSVLLGCFAALTCHGTPAPAATFRPSGTRAVETPAIVEPIYEHGLKGQWQDHGWADHLPKRGEAEVLALSNYGGWILANPRLTGIYGGLVFRFRTSPTWGDFFQVRVDSDKADTFPRVMVGPEHRIDLESGWSEVFISMSELNPTLVPFNRVVIRAAKSISGQGEVEFDHLGLTQGDPVVAAKAEALRAAPGQPAAFVVNCAAPPTPISPLIYGIAFSPLRELASDHQFKLNATARRWGGNPTSRYNWELGNAWNTGSDYFFENTHYGHRTNLTWAAFLATQRERNLMTALTVPMLGWVAKDTKSVGFSTDEFGPQARTDSENPKAGNGVSKSGRPLPPGAPALTSIRAPPEFIGQWVSAMTELEKQKGPMVQMYILDNEPMLWHDTHRDVHPEPVTYDELLERTIAYGTAVRKAAPQALIAGPAEWGWPAYAFSAADAKAGFALKPDRRAHGDVPLIEWYLQKLAEHEKKTGVRVLDVLDLHYYPQAKGLGVGTDGQTDRETNALRIRSTRSLWDARYTDESYIKEPIRLIPRMKEWVARNHPGLKLSIGEYNFGAERHMSGGLALAEALGRFGQQGLYSAFYWSYPLEGSPAFWAFRAFRNYDGRGAHFLPYSMPTEGPPEASLFAARSEDGRTVTLVALNFSTADALDAHLDLRGCARADSQRVFTYTGDPSGFVEQPKATVGRSVRLPPYSMSVIEVKLPRTPAPAQAGGTDAQ